MDLRLCLREPIPEIFEAARLFQQADVAHRSGDRGQATEFIRQADMPAIRKWCDGLWGQQRQCGSAYVELRARFGQLAAARKRCEQRNANAKQVRELIARDGRHCLFCGIPVIRSEVIKRIRDPGLYGAHVHWTNSSDKDHAGLRALMMSADHVVPWSRGGDTTLDNLIVTCSPCNCGRSEYTLEEAGLIESSVKNSQPFDLSF